MFKVTKEWIHQHKTARGGWTKMQLQIVGQAWPPVPGWIDKVVNSDISLSEYERVKFERIAKGEPN